jgi:hypothetical protein
MSDPREKLNILNSVKFRGTIRNGIFFHMRFFILFTPSTVTEKRDVTPTNRADLHTATSLPIRVLKLHGQFPRIEKEDIQCRREITEAFVLLGCWAVPTGKYSSDIYCLSLR